MAKIKEISTIYRHYLARTFRPNTVNDYSKRLLMLERFASMHDITTLGDADFDESVLVGSGYAYGATVNITEISSVFGKRTIKSLRGDDTNGNKVYPYTKVDYKPEDANGNSIVGKKYPMQNWCVSFYVRLENE